MSNYFRNIPNLLYPSLNPQSNSLFDYDEVKNFFRRVKIKDEYFQSATYFYKYQVKGNDRPDTVAEKIYQDPLLDWLVLVSNNITDVYQEWPLDDITFYEHLNKKYPNQSYLDIVYYETTEVKDSKNRLILPAGLRVDSTFQIRNPLNPDNMISPIKSISYLDIEKERNDKKRNIFLVRSELVNKVKNDLKEILYSNSSQFENKALKRVENNKI